MVQCSGAFICAGAVVASGLVADQIGRRMLLLVSAGLIAIFAIASTIAPLIFEENAIGQTIYVNAGFALLGFLMGNRRVPSRRGLNNVIGTRVQLLPTTLLGCSALVLRR